MLKKIIGEIKEKVQKRELLMEKNMLLDLKLLQTDYIELMILFVAK